MKKENRLKKRKQFNWTFKNGTTVHADDLFLVFTSSWSKGYKIGYSISKKVGKAVVRNKIKRRLYSIVEKYKNNICEKHTLIFVAKPTIVEKSFVDLESQVVLLLNKSKLFKEL